MVVSAGKKADLQRVGMLSSLREIFCTHRLKKGQNMPGLCVPIHKKEGKKKKLLIMHPLILTQALQTSQDAASATAQ